MWPPKVPCNPHFLWVYKFPAGFQHWDDFYLQAASVCSACDIKAFSSAERTGCCAPTSTALCCKCHFSSNMGFSILLLPQNVFERCSDKTGKTALNIKGTLTHGKGEGCSSQPAPEEIRLMCLWIWRHAYTITLLRWRVPLRIKFHQLHTCPCLAAR